MDKFFGGVAIFFAVLGALPAWAIDVVIAPGATARVESTNVISVSPVNVGANPLVAPGNYVVRFQWDPLNNVLVPISATPAALGNVGREINGVVIEAESLEPSIPYPTSWCWLEVRVRNRSGAPKRVLLSFDAFNAAGRRIGYITVGGGVVGANQLTHDDTARLTGRWEGTGWLWASPTCDLIDRYDLDLSRSYALPPS